MTDVLNQEPQIKSFPLPWNRFWARCIDLTIHAVISLLMYLFSGISPYIRELIHQTGNINFKIYIIVWVTVSGVFLLYESFFLGIFGTTPGKALFHIRVTGSDGKSLSFGAALVRAISLYWYGLYFYLFITYGPIVGFWLSSRYYKKMGNFRWDKCGNSIVSQTSSLVHWRRNVAILLAIFCITLRLAQEFIIIYGLLTKFAK